MKPPTTKEIRKEVNDYKQHLDNGGLPTQIVLELQPTEEGVVWISSVKNPPKSPLLSYFTLIIKEAIEKAAKVPSWIENETVSS